MISALVAFVTVAVSATALIVLGVAKLIWSVFFPGRYDDEKT